MVSFQTNEINAITCGDGTISDGEGGQCIPTCGDGTVYNSTAKECQEPSGNVLDVIGVEIEIAIAIGVIAGIVATIFGIFWTIHQGSLERKKEDLELIQKYGEELTNIVNTEIDLATKLDCTIYAERYLDTLEQIAILYHKEMLRESVAEFFENNFRYGLSIWRWYKKNVQNYPEYEIELQMTKGLKDIENLDEETKLELQTDRWFYFRWYCEGGDRDI